LRHQLAEALAEDIGVGYNREWLKIGDAGCRMQDAGFKIGDSGLAIQFSRSLLLASCILHPAS
jgi:hypothetical protein